MYTASESNFHAIPSPSFFFVVGVGSAFRYDTEYQVAYKISERVAELLNAQASSLDTHIGSTHLSICTFLNREYGVYAYFVLFLSSPSPAYYAPKYCHRTSLFGALFGTPPATVSDTARC